MKNFEMKFKPVEMDMGDSTHQWCSVGDNLVIKDIDSGKLYYFKDVECYIEEMFADDYYVPISQFLSSF